MPCAKKEKIPLTISGPNLSMRAGLHTELPFSVVDSGVPYSTPVGTIGRGEVLLRSGTVLAPFV
jgi:hypothetical protein